MADNSSTTSDHAIQAERLEAHYQSGQLLDRISRGLKEMGCKLDRISIEDLAPVDEFHIGGRPATQHLFQPIQLDSSHHVLDVGCGLGGTSRFLADVYGCRVTGIDLTREYVTVGNQLCAWVGLDDRIELQTGNALALAYPESSFDAVCLLHVGMNIPDKSGLFESLSRVLKPGGILAVYDVMQTGEAELAFPVPWASQAEDSALASVSEYQQAIEDAGMQVTHVLNRHDFAVEFFATLQAKLAAGRIPPLGLHLLMGETAKQKIQNMIENVAQHRVAPVEIRAQKPR